MQSYFSSTTTAQQQHAAAAAAAAANVAGAKRAGTGGYMVGGLFHGVLFLLIDNMIIHQLPDSIPLPQSGYPYATSQAQAAAAAAAGWPNSALYGYGAGSPFAAMQHHASPMMQQHMGMAYTPCILPPNIPVCPCSRAPCAYTCYVLRCLDSAIER
jgi:hypothetical protein